MASFGEKIKAFGQKITGQQPPEPQTLPQTLLRQVDEATTLTWKQVCVSCCVQVPCMMQQHSTASAAAVCVRHRAHRQPSAVCLHGAYVQRVCGARAGAMQPLQGYLLCAAAAHSATDATVPPCTPPHTHTHTLTLARARTHTQRAIGFAITFGVGILLSFLVRCSSAVAALAAVMRTACASLVTAAAAAVQQRVLDCQGQQQQQQGASAARMLAVGRHWCCSAWQQRCMLTCAHPHTHTHTHARARARAHTRARARTKTHNMLPLPPPPLRPVLRCCHAPTALCPRALAAARHRSRSRSCGRCKSQSLRCCTPSAACSRCSGARARR
jgi:hypothetical protein